MEASNAHDARNHFQARHHASAAQRHGADDMPRMLTASEEQQGSLPVGDGQAGRGAMALLALLMERGGVL